MITLLFGDNIVEIDALPQTELYFQANIQSYMAHLHQLGFAGIFQKNNHKVIYSDAPRIQIEQERVATTVGTKGTRA
jgi:hypothetical protein